MSRFTVKDALTGLDAFVVAGYVNKGVQRYGGYRNPDAVTLESFGTLEVAEGPTTPDEDSYGDHETGVVVKVIREGTTEEKYYRVDMTLDSYGSDPQVNSEPYEVVAREVSVTRFERR